MKRTIPMLLMFAIVLAVLGNSAPALALTPSGETQALEIGFQYPITPDSDDWESYTVTEKVQMLQIPSETLATMSNRDLVKALASYPYLVDIYVYGMSVSDGIDVVKTYCSALDELLKRDGGIVAINDYLNDDAAEGLSDFEWGALDDIYHVLWSADLPALALTPDLSPLYVSPDFVMTPNGTQVPVEEKEELYSESVRAAYNDLLGTLYSVVLIESGTSLYNCHYYAWHLNGNTDYFMYRWMPNPSAYMTDGSYTLVYSGNINTPHCSTNVRYGDIIFYGSTDNLDSTHSAICIDTTITDGALRSLHCISKWGVNGIFDHYLGNVPSDYDTTTISVWRLS